MKLLEYQAKKILRDKGLPVPDFALVKSVEDVGEALSALAVDSGVVKAQVFTGGRGKAGGIKMFSDRREAVSLVSEMLGMKLVTKQTGEEGVLVNELIFEKACNIKQEFYIAFMLDRSAVNPVIIISSEGGMDIEEVSEKRPEKIMRLYPEFNKPLSDEITGKACDFLGLDEKLRLEFSGILKGLFEVSYECDTMLLEINPLALTQDNGFIILDCKFDIDDNANFRQMNTGGDPYAEKTASEIMAANQGMSYISLDGNIGCMVNGAGLAMATLDSIKYNGGNPANFLDVGGSASEEAVSRAIEIITSDHTVECILVNIFGGIMRCDTIAAGIVAAVGKSDLKIPMVVRLEGNNVETGKRILADSGLNIISASDLDDAARKAVLAIKNKN